MPAKKHKPEVIIGKLREVEIVLDKLRLRAHPMSVQGDIERP